MTVPFFRQNGAAVAIPSATYGSGRRGIAWITAETQAVGEVAVLTGALYSQLYDDADPPTKNLQTINTTTGVCTDAPSASATRDVACLGRSSRLARLMMGFGSGGGGLQGFAQLVDLTGAIGESGNDYYQDTTTQVQVDFWGLDYSPVGSSRAVALVDETFGYADGNLVGKGSWVTGPDSATSPVIVSNTLRHPATSAADSEALWTGALTSLNTANAWEVLVEFTKVGTTPGFFNAIVGNSAANYMAFQPDYTNNHGFPAGTASNQYGFAVGAAAINDPGAWEIDNDCQPNVWGAATWQRYIVNPDTSISTFQKNFLIRAGSPFGGSPIVTKNLAVYFDTYGASGDSQGIMAISRLRVMQPTSEIVMAVMHDPLDVAADIVGVYQMPAFPGDGSGGSVAGYLTTITPFAGSHGKLSGQSLMADGVNGGMAIIGLTGGAAATGTLLLCSDTASITTAAISGWSVNGTSSNIISIAVGNVNTDGSTRIWVLTDDVVAGGTTKKNLVAVDAIAVTLSVSAAKSGSNVVLTMTCNVTPDHYKISKDGGAYGSNTNSPYTDTGGASSSHTYIVRAYDAIGNVLAQATASYNASAPGGPRHSRLLNLVAVDVL